MPWQRNLEKTKTDMIILLVLKLYNKTSFIHAHLKRKALGWGLGWVGEEEGHTLHEIQADKLMNKKQTHPKAADLFLLF